MNQNAMLLYDFACDAAKESKDESTKVGSAIRIAAGDILSDVNGFPMGVALRADRLQRPAKYDWVVHAESRVLMRCALMGFRTRHAVIASTQIPCSTCMGLIIEAGIKQVVCPKPQTIAHNPDPMAFRWQQNATISICMAQEAAINIVYIDKE